MRKEKKRKTNVAIICIVSVIIPFVSSDLSSRYEKAGYLESADSDAEIKK